MMNLKTMFILDRLHFGKKIRSRGKQATSKNQKLSNIAKNHSNFVKEFSRKTKNQSKNSYSRQIPAKKYSAQQCSVIMPMQ
ncbi:MAG: hypothetical protein GY820_35275 [Gammaproteobacteria bacterium]|nr:hypothetical protein [Gammaproteobacteria bacterium]